MNIEQFFYEHPVFRHEEFVAWKMAQHRECKPASINVALHYYIKTKRIKAIRRNLYAVVIPGRSLEDVVDPYLICAKATSDSVLGYHTALELMGVAYSTFGQFTYISSQKSKPFYFQEQWFQSVATSAALKKINKKDIYVDTINRQGVLLKVTHPSRTFVDVLNRIELSGGWEEVCRSINNFTALNIDEIIDYCFILNNLRLNATVGYFLSLRKGAFAVEAEKLKLLLKAVPKVPQYGSKNVKEKFKLIKPWNILLPESVVNQSWEEPDV